MARRGLSNATRAAARTQERLWLSISSIVLPVMLATGRGGARASLWWSGLVAVALHAGLWAITSRLQGAPTQANAATPPPTTEVELEPPPVAVAPPPPPPKEPEPAAAPREPVERPSVRSAPSPAQAAQIIAQEPTPSGPVDLSGDVFVTGTASTYAGGVTAPSGTSAHAVSSLVATPAPERSHGAATPVLSRPVTLEGGEWQCPWPHEAEEEQIDEQTVTLRVLVAADGHARAVDVLGDPGYGFGAAARACAMLTRFTPALDPAGHPTEAKSPPIRVRFTR